MILIADNIQITNPKIRQAVEKKDPNPIKEIAASCIHAGAEYLDINTGPLTKNPEKDMSFIIEAAQSVTDAPMLLDTSNPTAIETGLQSAKNHVIINGFSLEPAKLKFILPLAKKYDAPIIGHLLNPNGHIPSTASERLNVAIELYQAVKAMDLPDENLIIDPIIAPAIWQDGVRQDWDVLSVIRQLPDLLGFPVKTIAGLSNLTTGKGPADKKKLLEIAYLNMLAGAGLSMALLNVRHKETVRFAKTSRIFIQEGIFTWEQMDF